MSTAVPSPAFFLVGCPRSGTTLLMRMLDAHRTIAMTSELGWIAPAYAERADLTPDGHVTDAFLARFAERRTFGRFDPFPVGRAELLARGRDGPLHYAALLSWLFERHGERVGKPVVGNKSVMLVRWVDTLHELWPETRFVHLVRDGRDVALSATAWRRAERLAQDFPTWREEPFATAALWWEWNVRLAREAGARIGEAGYAEVRYERLVADPRAELERLCAFLGVEFDDAVLRFHEGRERVGDDLDAKHAWRPPTAGLRDWRTQMAAAELERFEAVAGDLLAELGYPRGPSPSEAATALASSLRAGFPGRPLPARWRPAAAAAAR